MCTKAGGGLAPVGAEWTQGCLACRCEALPLPPSADPGIVLEGPAAADLPPADAPVAPAAAARCDPLSTPLCTGGGDSGSTLPATLGGIGGGLVALGIFAALCVKLRTRPMQRTAPRRGSAALGRGSLSGGPAGAPGIRQWQDGVAGAAAASPPRSLRSSDTAGSGRRRRRSSVLSGPYRAEDYTDAALHKWAAELARLTRADAALPAQTADTLDAAVDLLAQMLEAGCGVDGAMLAAAGPADFAEIGQAAGGEEGAQAAAEGVALLQKLFLAHITVRQRRRAEAGAVAEARQVGAAAAAGELPAPLPAALALGACVAAAAAGRAALAAARRVSATWSAGSTVPAQEEEMRRRGSAASAASPAARGSAPAVLAPAARAGAAAAAGDDPDSPSSSTSARGAAPAAAAAAAAAASLADRLAAPQGAPSEAPGGQDRPRPAAGRLRPPAAAPAEGKTQQRERGSPPRPARQAAAQAQPAGKAKGAVGPATAARQARRALAASEPSPPPPAPPPAAGGAAALRSGNAGGQPRRADPNASLAPREQQAEKAAAAAAGPAEGLSREARAALERKEALRQVLAMGGDGDAVRGVLFR
eukprot:TRINITY_DN31681_c1_g1_i1.p1 TRINITY_DN31681_c1_g1~~TRINITY_DN31681_c1_g1_i1.p1  ORF type:complete len:590 (+),score=179.53 TRINITY_DN31681_c1_g1_i1:82-1851(+)